MLRRSLNQTEHTIIGRGPGGTQIQPGASPANSLGLKSSSKSSSKEIRVGRSRAVVQQAAQSRSQRRLCPQPKLPSVERTAAVFGSKAKIKNADPYVLGKPIYVPIRSVQRID